MPSVADAGAGRFSRVFDVLELLVGHTQGMTLTEIVKRLDLPPSSAHNLLQRMASTDMIAVSNDLRYSIGSRAVRLGIRVVDSVQVRTVARRILLDLARDTGDDIYLAVRLGTRVSYIDRAAGTRPVDVNIRLGQSLYLHATAVGKLFAAFNPQMEQRMFADPRPRLTKSTLVDEADLAREIESIRSTGYSTSQEEAVVGIVGYAFPVRDAYGDMAAAIHVSVPLPDLDATRERTLVSKGHGAAAMIESDLGWTNSGARPGRR